MRAANASRRDGACARSGSSLMAVALLTASAAISPAAAGAAWSAPVTVSSPREQATLLTQAGDAGGAAAAWVSNGAVLASLRDPVSGVWSAPLTLSGVGEHAVSAPSVAVDAAGDATVAWSSRSSDAVDADSRVEQATHVAGTPGFARPEVLVSAIGVVCPNRPPHNTALCLFARVDTPTVAMNAAGVTLVAWQSLASQTLSARGFRAATDVLKDIVGRVRAAPTTSFGATLGFAERRGRRMGSGFDRVLATVAPDGRPLAGGVYREELSGSNPFLFLAGQRLLVGDPRQITLAFDGAGALTISYVRRKHFGPAALYTTSAPPSLTSFVTQRVSGKQVPGQPPAAGVVASLPDTSQIAVTLELAGGPHHRLLALVERTRPDPLAAWGPPRVAVGLLDGPALAPVGAAVLADGSLAVLLRTTVGALSSVVRSPGGAWSAPSQVADAPTSDASLVSLGASAQAAWIASGVVEAASWTP